jgi:hypothetical protein
MEFEQLFRATYPRARVVRSAEAYRAAEQRLFPRG